MRGQKGSGVGLYVVKCLADDLGFEVNANKNDNVFEITPTKEIHVLIPETCDLTLYGKGGGALQL